MILHLYDGDGTLWDGGIDYTQIYKACYNKVFEKTPSRDSIMEQFGKCQIDFLTGACESLGITPSEEQKLELYREWKPRSIEAIRTGKIELLQGVPDCLEDGRIIRGVATYNTESIGEAILEQTGLKSRFQVLGYGLLKDNKTRIVRAAVTDARRQYGEIEHIVMFGDSECDMEGGITVGAHCVGLLTGRSSEDELRKAGAKTILASLVESEYEQIPQHLR